MGKRIAFIDRCGVEPEGDSLIDRTRFEENREIIQRLGVRHDVVPYGKLCEETCRKLREDSGANGGYYTIITHVPYSEDPAYSIHQEVRKIGDTFYIEGGYGREYQPSLDILKSLSEEFPETVIIAYTGAGYIDLPDRILHHHGVCRVLRRSIELGRFEMDRDMGRLRMLTM